MADKNIKVGLEVSSNGTIDKELSKSEKLRKSLEGAASAMSRTGGTAGSRAVAAGYSASMTGQEYGQARGSAGATGASARDFANQAQGLGGLVRLYATYAANLFAVTAAFQALSNAMETSNMVKGLDQLGAASGVALGSLSSDFVKATDGAVSFREAMEATAKATSSGMSKTQLLDLGEVAKKASQALGVNMSDAVSRLTRGITKLEPELLDELGIFTKVGKATEDYARKIGKAESNLTDFERRQAFANAVLEEGKKKFSEIDIPSNPYAKFLAALKDVGQTILEVINKGVVPLINFLSSNPTALLAAIGAIASLILKQALPAIGQYRNELRKTADEALEVANAKSEAAKKALIVARDAKAKEIQLEKEKIAELRTAQVDAAEDRLRAVSKKGLSASVREILKTPDLQSITADQIALLDKLGSKQTKVSAAYRELAASIKAAQQANADYIASEKALEAQRTATPGIFSPAGVAAWRAEQARRAASSKNILANVGDTASEAGTIAAFKSLGSQLSTEKLGAIRTGFVGVAGAISILGTAVGNVLTVVSRFMGWVGLVIGAYQLLSSTFSKNGAEVSAYEDSLKSLESVTKTANDTAKKYNNTISVDGILARNTALNETADAMMKVSAAFETAKAKASWFDDFTNSIMGLFGASLEDKLTEQLVNSISAALKNISDPKLKQEAENQILALTGAKSIDQVETKLKSLNKQDLKSVNTKVTSAIKGTAEASDKAVQPLKSLKDSLSALDKSFLELQNSLMEKSPVTDFATKLTAASRVLQEALNDPRNAVAALNKILEDTSQIKMFPPAAQNSILEAAKNMQALQTQAQSAQEQIDIANKKLAAARDMEGSGVAPEVVLRFKLEAEGQLKAATDTYVAATEKMRELTTNVDSALKSTVADSIKLIEGPLTRAIAQANIETSKTLLQFLPKTGETVKLETQLEIESIALRKQELSQTRDLIAAINLDRISREKQSLRDQLSRPNADANAEEFRQKQQQFKDLEQEEKAYKNPKALKASGEILSVGAQNALRQNAGFLAQMEALSGQQQAARIRGAVGAVGADFDKQRQAQQEALKYYEAEQRALQSSSEYRDLSIEQQQKLNDEYYAATDALKSQIELSGYKKDVETQSAILEQAKLVNAKNVIPLAEEALSKAKAQLAAAEETVANNQKAAKQDRDRAAATQLLTQELAKQSIELEHQNALRKIGEDITVKLEDVRKQELDYLLNSGQISQNKYTQEIAAIERTAMLRDKNNQLIQLEATYIMEVTKLLEDYAKAGSETDKSNIVSRIQNKYAEYQAQVTGINRVYDAQSRLKDQQLELTADQQGYMNIVRDSFNGMADALVTWAQTGKLSGKDLFNSLIADLARFELRLQMMAMYAQLRPGIASALSSLLPGFGSVSASANVPGGSGWGMDLGQAQGGVWNAGLQMFAKGGMFTNSIVNSPTLFKFAHGTGLMGEAGPEAIMPLKRDSNGNLGVRAAGQQGNVEVVVNNFSNQQATTKESKDGRGNRRIEVIIGEAAAGEMSRSGSSSQGALKNTYGLTPQLIRR